MTVRATRLAAGIAAFIFVCAGSRIVQAEDAFWHGVRSDIWNQGISGGVSNWYSDHPPNGVALDVPTTTAIFADGALRTSIVIKQDAAIGRIRFDPDAPVYSFRIARARKLSLTGRGLTNGSASTPQFTVLQSSLMELTGTARFIASGGAAAANIQTVDGGRLTFGDQTQGGNATVHNDRRGQTVFRNKSSAGQMIITNQNRGVVMFLNLSTGDHAHLINGARGEIDASFGGGPAGDGVIPVGAIDNGGVVDLSSNTLKVAQTFTQTGGGSLNLDLTSSTLFGSIVTTQGATLGGDLNVTAHLGIDPGNYKIIHAKGGRTGTFARLTFTGRNDLKARLAYSGKEVVLIVTEK
jgi:hypothetical protein